METNEDEMRLAAFLDGAGEPDARAAYAAWLEGQGGPRGEYLRLLIGLDEPQGPEGREAARGRIRELRAGLAPVWADKVDRSRLAFDGLYQSGGDRDHREYLRFYPNGTVFSVSSTGTPEQVIRWFRQGNSQGSFSRGYYSLRGDELEFSTSEGSSDPGPIHPRFSGTEEDWREIREGEIRARYARRVEYAGTVGPRSLFLSAHSFINDHRDQAEYRFAAVAEPVPVVPATPAERPPRIGVRHWQNHSSPRWRRVAVSINSGSSEVLIPADLALRLASAVESQHPATAARLREAADELQSALAEGTPDPTEDFAEARLGRGHAAEASQILGIDPPIT